MTLDKEDEIKIQKIVEKTTVKVVVEALEKVILPKFDDYNQENQKQFKKINDKLEDIEVSSNRVETLVKSEIKYVDELSDRVLVLEKAHK